MKSTTYVGLFFKSENCQACQSKTRRKALKIFLPRSAKFVCCRCYDSYDLYGARTKVCRVLLFRELFVSSDECQAGARLETCAALTDHLRYRSRVSHQHPSLSPAGPRHVPTHSCLIKSGFVSLRTIALLRLACFPPVCDGDPCFRRTPAVGAPCCRPLCVLGLISSLGTQCALAPST